MRIITVTFIDTEDGQLVVPDEPLPQDSIANKFDGEKYVIYEIGDELPVMPPQPIGEPVFDNE